MIKSKSYWISTKRKDSEELQIKFNENIIVMLNGAGKFTPLKDRYNST